MARAVEQEGLKHVVWSTLEDAHTWVPLDDERMPTLLGNYKVPHFDAKGEADQAFIGRGVSTTFMLASFYWDNLIHFGMGPKRGPDGTLAITLSMGDKPLSGIAAEDIGKCVHGIFNRGGGYIGRRVGLAGDHLTDLVLGAWGCRVFGNDPADVAAAFGEALGKGGPFEGRSGSVRFSVLDGSRDKATYWAISDALGVSRNASEARSGRSAASR